MKKCKANKHVRHLCRTHKTPLADVLAVISTNNKKDAMSSIRKRVLCTWAAAEVRYFKANAVLDVLRKEVRVGDKRRKIARQPDPLTIAERKAHQLRRLVGSDAPGGDYSGVTSWHIKPVSPEDVESYTTTSTGEQYTGRGHINFRTDARHVMHLSLTTIIAARRTPVPRLVDNNFVVSAKLTRPDIYAVKVVTQIGKQVELRPMFAADQGGGQWYLGKTERGAVTALNRSRRVSESEKADRINAEVIRSWGWCSDGALDWCRANGITRDVRRRMKRGVKSGALSRLIHRHGGPSGTYERRLVAAAH